MAAGFARGRVAGVCPRNGGLWRGNCGRNRATPVTGLHVRFFFFPVFEAGLLHSGRVLQTFWECRKHLATRSIAAATNVHERVPLLRMPGRFAQRPWRVKLFVLEDVLSPEDLDYGPSDPAAMRPAYRNGRAFQQPATSGRRGSPAG